MSTPLDVILGEYFPVALTDVVLLYMPLGEIITLTINNLLFLPSTRFWEILMKHYYPAIYVQFKANDCTGLTETQVILTILAGLYTYNPPLSHHAQMDGTNLKLYLELTHFYLPDLSVELLYEVAKQHSRLSSIQSLLYLFNLHVQLTLHDLIYLIEQTSKIETIECLIEAGVQWYDQEFLNARLNTRVCVNTVSVTVKVYTYLIVSLPHLAVKYAHQAEISWSDFKIFIQNQYNRVEPHPSFDYTKLMQAYYEQIAQPSHDTWCELWQIPKLMRQQLKLYL